MNPTDKNNYANANATSESEVMSVRLWNFKDDANAKILDQHNQENHCIL